MCAQYVTKRLSLHSSFPLVEIGKLSSIHQKLIIIQNMM